MPTFEWILLGTPFAGKVSEGLCFLTAPRGHMVNIPVRHQWRSLCRAFLLLLGPSLLLPPQLAHTQTAEGYLLEEGTDEPIVLGAVFLVWGSGEIAAQTYSDESGFFSLSPPDPGQFFLRAERVGYSPRMDGVFEIGEGGSISVVFRLRRAPVPLDTLAVTAERRVVVLRQMGFYQRQEEEEGIFLGPEELAEIPAFQATQFFRRLPRVRVNEGPMGSSTITIAGAGRVSLKRKEPCYPKVLIDGITVFRGGVEAAMLDSAVQPNEIIGIEIYRGASEIPARWGGSSSPCGLILIWTG